MNRIEHENETLAAQHLQDALIAIQEAQSELLKVKNATTDIALSRRVEEMENSLALIRRIGNQEYIKLRDYLDGGA